MERSCPLPAPEEARRGMLLRNPPVRWGILVRNSPLSLGNPGENTWGMLPGNDILLTGRRVTVVIPGACARLWETFRQRLPSWPTTPSTPRPPQPFLFDNVAGCGE